MFDVYEMITSKIISELEKGNIPWKRPWIRPQFSNNVIKMKVDKNEVAYNAITGKTYSLLNQMLLMRTGAYASYNQINELGGHVKKGEKASVIVYWNMREVEEKDESGETKTRTIPTLKYYQVFHIETQTEDVDMSKVKDPIDVIETSEAIEGEKTWDNVETADKVLTDYYLREHIEMLQNNQDRAFYSPSTDKISLPKDHQFKNCPEYYSTLFHETIHSTGHKNRLNRLDTFSSFGNENYAKEELVAEIGASAMNNIFNIATEQSFTNNVAYVQSWLKALKNDKKLIVSASSKAEKAINFILEGC